MTLNGIDISVHNEIDWNKFDDIDFVIIRAGYGKLISQRDKKLDQHYTAAKQRGKHIGIYWYSYAKTPAEAELEAKTCLEAIKGLDIDFPVYFDIEEQKQRALGRETCSAMVKAFCDIIESAGYIAGFYCNVGFYNDVISDDIKKRYTCWIAHWNVKTPAVSTPMWQYTDSNGTLDRDYAYTDFSTWKNPVAVTNAANKTEFPIEIKIGDTTYIGAVTEQ